MEDLLKVGVITTTHGVRGEVKVFPTTDDAERFLDIEYVLLDTGKELRRLNIQNVKFFKRFSLRFGNPVCCPATTYVRDKFEGEPFEVRVSSNVDWMMLEKQSRKEGSFCYIPMTGMYHRIHEKSTTTEIIHGDIRWREDYEMFRKFWPAWVAKPLVRVYRLSEKSKNIQQRAKK